MAWGLASSGFPEVAAARAVVRVVLAAEVVGDLLLYYVVSSVLGRGPLLGLAAAAAFAAASAPLLASVARRPGRLEGKLRSFDSWCGGALRFGGGAYPVYYCWRDRVMACYDPVDDAVRVVEAEETGRRVEAPDRRDFRCTFRVRGSTGAQPGGAEPAPLFKGVLYAPAPGDPASMLEVTGSEAVVEVDCGDPARAAEEALRLLRSLRGGGAG